MDLLDQFESLTLLDLEGMVNDRRQEELLLDFKTAPDWQTKKDDVRQKLAKALSGFGNAAGGLIIWGVDCRKDGRNVDAAQRLAPVDCAEGLLTELQTYTAHATSPIVEGVQHRIVQVEDDEGYLVTLVPESLSGPHMAKCGIDRYYKRSGSQFRPMEHFDVADMFGRRRAPKLTLHCEVVRGWISNHSTRIEMILAIENNGRGPATYPALEIDVSGSPHCRPSEYGLDGNGHTGLPNTIRGRSKKGTAAFGGGVNDIVHVGARQEVTKLVYEIDNHNPDRIKPITLSYRIYSADSAVVEGTYKVTEEDLVRAAND